MENNEFISSSNIDIYAMWERIKEELVKEVSTLTYEVFILNLDIVDIKENTLVVSTGTKSSEKALVKIKNQIINGANRAYKNITALEIIVNDKKETEVPAKKEEVVETNSTTVEEKPAERVYVDENTASLSRDAANFRFDPKYTFDNFIVGPSNQFAAAAAQAVAETPGAKFNPLFIYGGSGLGKTHLLYAIGNYIQDNNPSLNVIYVTTNKFTDDFVNSLKSKSTSKFKETYLKADVLIIDDIQEIIGREQTQEQFFNLFNELHQRGKHIVITSDKQPKELNPLEERLRSRLEWGMLVDIGVPDIETRIAILNKKAQIERYNVSREVIEYIAEIATSNVRTMEGYLSRAVFYSSLLKEDIVTIESAREALKNIAKDDEESIDATKIIDIVCKFYNIKKEEVLARKRTKQIAEARQIAMYLITEFINIPLESVGNIFGKDHATVIYAKNKIQDDMKKSKKLEVQINDLKKMIEGK